MTVKKKKKKSAAKKKKIGRAPKAARLKKTVKRAKPKAAAVKKAALAKSSETAGLEKVGEVTHYFPKVKAAAVLILKDGLKTGDPIYIKGHTTNFKQTLASMQLEHVSIPEAKKTQEIGIMVKSRVRVGDTVYKI